MQKALSRERTLITAAVVIGIAAAMTLAVAFIRDTEARTYRRRIDAVYQKAFYETCEMTESMAANYAKLVVTGTDAQSQVLLNDISKQCQGAVSNLSMLPIGQETVSATIKFVNQAGDFASTLCRKVAMGQEITGDDVDNMLVISNTAGSFSEALNALAVRYADGERIFSEDASESGDESLYPLTGSAADYPTLMYDGPFADVERNGNYLALEGTYEILPEEGQRILEGFLDAPRSVRYDGESDLEAPCYEYTADMGTYTINAGITRKGGMLLYMLSDISESVLSLTEQQCTEIARQYLLDCGFGDMRMRYYSSYAGILTINFAALQDDVVLYPDLVKVQVDMNNGNVIGLESHGYLQNHMRREFPSSLITSQSAVDAISPVLHAQSAELCVIPQDKTEYLCYEITATSSVGMFMVYIDAQTGEEREILQVVDSGSGTLVM